MLCIYCQEDKPEKDLNGQGNFSLEHVIPQSLGGKLAYESLKTRQVCRVCNNNLGQFVDASFTKDWFVSNALALTDRACYSPDLKADRGLMLTSMGEGNFVFPHVSSDEVCETWLGPFGEIVVWVRKKDEDLYWYSGGNPRTTKKEPSRAYFMFSENSERAPWLTLRTFKQAFANRKVKRILCTTILLDDKETNLWFDTPDDLDLLRTSFFRDEMSKNQTRKGMKSFYVWSERRFMSKLSIGILHSIFGLDFRDLGGAKLLYNGLNSRNSDSSRFLPKLIQNYAYDKTLKKQTGIEGAIVIALLPSKNSLILNINIGTDYACLIRTVSTKKINRREEFEQIASDGLYWIICEPLGIFCSLTGFQFDSYKAGRFVTNELKLIEEQVKKSKNFFANISGISSA